MIDLLTTLFPLSSIHNCKQDKWFPLCGIFQKGYCARTSSHSCSSRLLSRSFKSSLTIGHCESWLQLFSPCCSSSNDIILLLSGSAWIFNFCLPKLGQQQHMTQTLSLAFTSTHSHVPLALCLDNHFQYVMLLCRFYSAHHLRDMNGPWHLFVLNLATCSLMAHHRFELACQSSLGLTHLVGLDSRWLGQLRTRASCQFDTPISASQ